MSTDLRPTPARLALLQAVADGEAWWSINGFCVYATNLPGKQTRRMDALIAADWVVKSDRRTRRGELYDLTTAGRQILDSRKETP